MFLDGHLHVLGFPGPSKPVVPSTSGMSDACIPENDDDTNCSDTFVTQSSRSRLVNLKDVTQSISITNSYTNSGTSPNCEDLNSEANTSASLESVKIAVSVHENFPVTINNDSLPRAGEFVMHFVDFGVGFMICSGS